MVLSNDGGALTRSILPFKMYMGCGLGDGKQYFPWIHIEDTVNILNYFLENEETKGAYNVVAPQLVDNKTFTEELANVLGTKTFFSVNKTILSTLLGESSTMLTEGCKISPQKLNLLNYQYRYPDLRSALENLLKK